MGDPCLGEVRDTGLILEQLPFAKTEHFSPHWTRQVILQTMYGQKKNFSTFSYKLVQISPIMILVNSGAFLSISRLVLRAHRTNFCHDTIHFFYWLPPKNARDYGSCASSEFK